MSLVRFKYKPLDDDGREQGVLSRKGEITPTELVLGDERVPLLAIAKTQRRLNRLFFERDCEGESTTTSIAITKGDARELKQGIDVICSGRWAQDRKQWFENKREAWRFKTAQCPYCKSTIDLSDFDATQQMYCPFCETIVNRAGPSPRDEHDWRLCDECGFYSRPKAFTSFYFYFLLVVYGFHWRRTTRCNACMRSESWKMLALNLPFVLGLPFAAWQLCRAYFGGAGTLSFKGIDAANHRARKGDSEAASAAYEAIAGRIDHAGIRYNLALTHARSDLTRCAEEAAAALARCSNFVPARELATHALKSLGRNDEAAQLDRFWIEAA